MGCIHDWILPPLRGSNVNIAFSVGYMRIAHSTHGWDPYAAMRLCVALCAMSLRDDVAPFGRNAVGCTNDWILPPLRGSNVNIAFSVGYVRIAHSTHGWDPYAAMRLSVALRANDTTAGRRRHTVTPFGRNAVGCTHDWILPLLRGSI